MLERLTSAAFSAHLHSSFRIHVEGLEPLESELIEVTELGSDGSSDQEGARRRPFSIVLRAPSNIVLPQRIYPVEHAALGTLQLFLVPLGPDRAGMHYEAIFT